MMSMEPNPAPADTPPKRSPVELIKENSRQLRGTLADELAQDTDHFNDQDKQLIKFHGSYQQDNRDARKDRHRVGGGKRSRSWSAAKSFGGSYRAQYLAIDRIAEKYNGTRHHVAPGLSMHGIMKSDSQPIAEINHVADHAGACGDATARHSPIRRTRAGLSRNCKQRTCSRAFRALGCVYHEIWLQRHKSIPIKTEGWAPEVEPIYASFTCRVN